MSPSARPIPSESHLRSILKGISWRLVATSTTILIAGLLLRNWGTAVAIGGAEMISKLFLYYVHERVWQLAPPGVVVGALMHRRPDTSAPAAYRESHLRSVLKTLSWRLVATGTTMGIAWGATSDVTAAAWIGGIEASSKLFLYYGHERAWQRLPRGTVRRMVKSQPRSAETAE